MAVEPGRELRWRGGTWGLMTGTHYFKLEPEGDAALSGVALLSGLVQGIPFILNALAGLLVGAQFPLANRIWLKRRGDQPGTAGVLYACDLVGACAGSIAASVILVPVLGTRIGRVRIAAAPTEVNPRHGQTG